MYIATLRIADEFGCEAIGIQYQQGLKDLVPASDLAEGLLNNVDRPPVKDRDRQGALRQSAAAAFQRSGRVRRSGCVDHEPRLERTGLAAGNDAARCSLRRDLRPRFERAIRVGAGNFRLRAACALREGYAEAVSERQPPMYFRLGGGTIKGISKPGDVVWSRIYVEPEGLKADLGLAHAIELPREETERRWQITTPQWPMMHAVFPGITRDQFMAQHCSNHIQVAYAPDAAQAHRALAAKASMFNSLGIATHFCGDLKFSA